MEYKPVIGLEIHSELKTESKMFCDCLNDSAPTSAESGSRLYVGKEANVNICPICMAQPGSLPVINQKAVDFVIKTGLVLNCQIPDSAKFDRKNYFYPDLPKGYQISQYDLPLALGGFLEIDNKKIKITRIHLEEDAGKLIHPQGSNYSLVDYNRAGLPLMELVTEPDIESSQQARQFCEELQLILRYLDVSEANMEKGQMRFEVNISLKSTNKSTKGEMGTKVEIKNLNSFKAVERSINYEIERQAQILDSGEKIIQETRGWDENKQKTFSQRVKEGSKDYRYFPEPDLPPLNQLSKLSSKLKIGLPELPRAKRIRFEQEYKIPVDDINILVSNKGLSDYFEQVVSELNTWLKIKSIDDKQPLIRLTANYLLTELQKLLLASKMSINNCKISPENFAEFITLIEQKEISSSAAQMVLKEMFETGADPSNIIEEKSLKQISDEETLNEVIKKVIKDNPKPRDDFKAGKENARQFLVGKVMAASRGQANPQIVEEILKKKLRK